MLLSFKCFNFLISRHLKLVSRQNSSKIAPKRIAFVAYSPDRRTLTLSLFGPIGTRQENSPKHCVDSVLDVVYPLMAGYKVMQMNVCASFYAGRSGVHHADVVSYCCTDGVSALGIYLVVLSKVMCGVDDDMNRRG